MSTAAVILAAGKGTRMNSELPKVAHEAAGKPLVRHVVDAARAAGCDKLIVVVGYGAGFVKGLLLDEPGVEFAVQTEQKGTGHAVLMAEPNLRNHTGPVLVLYGDMPLVTASSLKSLLDAREAADAACVVGSAVTENNHGLGRVIRNADGDFLRIVEEKDATDEERAVTEINTGCYAFAGPALLSSLAELAPNNAQREYYLTDCPAILKDRGETVTAETALTIEEALGVNTPEQLAEVERVLAGRSSENSKP
ncbi:sugar phosphate nucleotidyltransferase [Alienimonas californiensis]|uniref:Bifunctional protein GlmU n=1 Tax=Alienimonas californiensis TaxID=2527989 RepID=A0A517PA64_9PLAN|nr:NTP transferase domain-containing protein [Alienimonas californiensis]QDT16259.1 Bifunctional protein GlmU [Alienimonas californiensis]